LLEEFIKGKETIFYTATQFGEQSNLEGLSESINAVVSPKTEGNIYSDFEKAFVAVTQHAKEINKPLIFIIDEYPYLAQSNMGISSILQKVIDHEYLKLPNLMLILTGSQLSFMRHQVMGYQSPLYGRRTGQIRLLPLSFEESRAFLLPFSPSEVLTIYGLTGGIPLYLSMIKPSLSLEENIKKNILNRDSSLYEEPLNLLLQEVRSPHNYNSILSAVASGATEVSRIMDKTKLESAAVSQCLNTLIDLHIVEKHTPLTEIGKRKPIYKIADGLFHFWHRYVPKYQRFIETNKLDAVWDRIERDLIQFTSLVFEEYCRNWIFLKSDILLQDIGAWWGNNPFIKNSKASAEEVDLVGVGFEKDELVLGECKWRNELTGLAVGKKLVERAKFFPYEKKELYIFSKSEFTDDLKAYAIENKIKLLTFEEMIGD
jgi:AAA+ ATPase superfamily predicted ATPase